MTNSRIRVLLDKLLRNECTPAEKQELFLLVEETNDVQLNEFLQNAWRNYDNPTHEMTDEKSKLILQSILNDRKTISPQPKVKRIAWLRMTAAACLILLLGIGSYFIFFKNPNLNKTSIDIAETNDVNSPQVNKAMITLANGQKVYLDNMANGSLASQANVNIEKLHDGEITYTGSASELLYNTLYNPRGSKVITLTLSDGTKVWLNAESSLRYPVAFTAEDRKVEITGEAYFEVAKLMNAGVKKPFIVEKGGMQVKVLGTHFNVNAYDDEKDIKVTLLEGSVQVSGGPVSPETTILKPGQQAILTPHLPLATHTPDLEQVMAWKNGLFSFDRTDIQTLMRSVSRWYDIDIVYEGAAPKGTISGEVQRSLSFLQMQKVLQLTDIKFRIEGKKLIVMPQK